MMLIAILPSFLPLNALIPVHGLTQVSSNISRAFFGYKDIQYEVIPKFLIGSVLGIGLLAGFFQTGLSMVVGATGPLTMTLLFKDYQDKDKVVATGAALMSITHFLKVVVFIYFGFVFFDFIWIIIAMIFGAVAGSFVGTKARNLIDGKKFTIILKTLLTILAIKLIVDIIVKII